MALTQVDGGMLSPINGQFYGMKSRIINGAMVIDQRNNGASVTINSDNAKFSADRWYFQGVNTDGVFTVQQSSTAPTGFTKSLLLTVTTADASIGSTQAYFFKQAIEGYNVADLGWGVAGAASITVSFWVRSSVTGTFGAAVVNGAGTRSYPFSYTVNSANTFEYKTITIAGDTSGTWTTDNSAGLALWFSVGAGSTYKGTANTWASTLYFDTTGSTNLIGTSGATFYITGVQLEKGSTATSFDYRPYTTELQLCQRYLPALNSASTSDYFEEGYAGNTTTAFGLFDFLVTPRIPPTGITVSNAGHFTVLMPSGVTMVCTSVAFSVASYKACRVAYIGASGLTLRDRLDEMPGL
jgi:hypothetical protein